MYLSSFYLKKKKNNPGNKISKPSYSFADVQTELIFFEDFSKIS